MNRIQALNFIPKCFSNEISIHFYFLGATTGVGSEAASAAAVAFKSTAHATLEQELDLKLGAEAACAACLSAAAGSFALSWAAVISSCVCCNASAGAVLSAASLYQTAAASSLVFFAVLSCTFWAVARSLAAASSWACGFAGTVKSATDISLALFRISTASFARTISSSAGTVTSATAGSLVSNDVRGGEIACTHRHPKEAESIGSSAR
mmetsp:Transcript_22524/g.45124  ORF Transcript_22524/g.45124 Transcript_22524/m.45124 type:complete len:209 (-) Transcript_22524:243-869(-)